MLQVGTLMLLLRRPTRGTGVPLRGSRGRSLRAFADAGGLMSYGASIPEVVRQTGIHRGGNSSGDLPVRRRGRSRLGRSSRICQ
jgi:hypothetical protein